VIVPEFVALIVTAPVDLFSDIPVPAVRDVTALVNTGTPPTVNDVGTFTTPVASQVRDDVCDPPTDVM